MSYNNIIQEGQLVAKWQNDEQRRAIATVYIDYYRNVYREILFDLLEKQITDNVECARIKQYVESEGVVEWLINEIALVFAKEPIIKPLNATGKVLSNEKTVESFETFLEDLNINVVLENIDQYVELLRDVAVIPIVYNKKLTLKIITPEKAIVIQDENDPTQMVAFLYQIGITEDSVGVNNAVDQYMCYDMRSGTLDSYKCKLYDNGEIDPASKIPVKTPAYTDIPVIMFRNYLPDDSFWYKGNSGIVDKSIAIDMRRTDLAMAEAYHIPHLVTTGLDEKAWRNLSVARTAYWNIPNDANGESGDAKFITPKDDLDKLKELINDRRKVIARNKGLSSDTIDGVTATSGYQLALSKQDILNINQRKRKYYTNPIRKLILLAIETAKYYNIINLTSVKNIHINYGELTFAQSDEEKARARAMDTQAGIWSPVQSLMADDPELTEEMAVKKVKQIEEWNKLVKPANPFEKPQEEEPSV